MTRDSGRMAWGIAATLSFIFAAAPALAQDATAKIDGADTAWMISATALVLMMTIPGLALFYSGMVRKKNVLATMAQSVACAALCSLLWFAVGYSLSFVGDAPALGTFERLFLRGIGMESTSAFAPTIPEVLYVTYQMTFAIITVALIAGAVADRMRFSAFLWFVAGWLLFVYVPIAHWVWGGGFLASAGVLDFAGGTVVHLNAGIAGLVAAYVLGKRHGYGSDNFAPHDLSLAVIGMGLLWVGWLGFNGGSALGANARAAFAITATHLAASTGALTWMFLEWWTRGKPSVLGLHVAEAAYRIRRFARRVRRPRHRRRDRHVAHGRVRGRGAVRRAGRAGGIAGTAGEQCQTGADPALRRRRGPRLVRLADLRPAQGNQLPPPAAGKRAARDRRSRSDPARRSAAISAGGRW